MYQLVQIELPYDLLGFGGAGLIADSAGDVRVTSLIKELDGADVSLSKDRERVLGTPQNVCQIRHVYRVLGKF